MFATNTSADRGHFLPIPRQFLALRLVQFVLAIVIFGMSCYGVHYTDLEGFALSLFTALATMIIVGYIFAAEFFLPVIYNYWAVLALDIFAVLFWLISFAVTADQVSDVYGGGGGGYGGYSVDLASLIKRAAGLEKRGTSARTYKNVMITTAVMGAFEFLLFIGTLVLTAIHLHRHRANGGHSMAHGSGLGVQSKETELTGQPVASTAPTAPTAAPTTAPIVDDSLPVQHPPPKETV